MTRSRTLSALAAVPILIFGGFLVSRADDTVPNEGQLPVAHPECTNFGAGRERNMRRLVRRGAEGTPVVESALSAMTDEVARALSTDAAAGAPGTRSAAQPDSIDFYIYGDLQANGIQPADKTNDWEF